MKKCIPCARAFHDECRSTEKTTSGCCCKPEDSVRSESFSDKTPIQLGSVQISTVGRPPKNDEEISISAGRKRAAELYAHEIGENLPCEWRGLADCGGGKHPIHGCISGIRRDIHHGPVKLREGLINNERSNISLICPYCHHRWHASNDPDYDEIVNADLPKNPRAMTTEETITALADESRYKTKAGK